MAIGALVFIGSQEATALLDPNKIGLLEKNGIIGTANNTDAKETLLASGFGFNRGQYELTTGSDTSSIKTSDPEQINRLKHAGYNQTKVSDAWTEQREVIAGVEPSESTSKIQIKIDGYANNGTKISDGNELRAYIQDGKFISGMRKGLSTGVINGENVSYDPSMAKGFITIGNSKFEIISKLNENGQLTWGENGVFTTTTGETIKAIGDNGEKLYKYFEIAIDNGVDENGIQHIVPLATDVGANTFSGKIQQVVTEAIEHPAEYVFTKAIPKTETFVRGVSTGGVLFAPLGRTGLGRAEAKPVPNNEAITPDGTAPVLENEVPASENETPEPGNATPENIIPDNNQGDTSSESNPVTSPDVSTSDIFEPDSASGPITGPSIEIATQPAPEPQPSSEPQPASPEPQPETTSEVSDVDKLRDAEIWDNEIKKKIEQNADLIGGQEGIKIITDEEPLNDVTSTRYGEWWNKLSDEGKQLVRDVVNQINTSNFAHDLDWGNGFRVWLAANDEV